MGSSAAPLVADVTEASGQGERDGTADTGERLSAVPARPLVRSLRRYIFTES